MLRLLPVLLLYGLMVSSCKKDEDDTPPLPPPPDTSVVVLQGNISASQTLQASRKYLIKGYVYVQDGATLTIEPGTVIKGDKATQGTLVFLRGSKIIADGTASAPIVFTSNQPVGERDKGDWGGIIICGRAPVNEPGEPEVEGGTGATYGGTNPDDNSGILRYVRIEFAGIALFTNQEINSLTMAGVGRGTTIEYVQVSYGGDDSFEWFGGTVNGRYLVSYIGFDDDFDSDLGYTGLNQFLFSVRHPQVADGSTTQTFESDNDLSGTNNQPFTAPVFSNVTGIGPYNEPADAQDLFNHNSYHRHGMKADKKTRMSCFNSVFGGWKYGLRIDGPTTTVNYSNGLAHFRNNIVACWGDPGAIGVSSDGAFDIEAWMQTSGFNNTFLVTLPELALTDPQNLSNPDPLPLPGSPALSGADFSHPLLQNSFFTPVSYRGAFGSTNWMAGWCNWDPKNTVY